MQQRAWLVTNSTAHSNTPARALARRQQAGCQPSCPPARGPCRFQMAETTCQPQFEPPHHLEWLIRRLSASSIWGRMRFFAGRPVRSWRRVLRFRRAPPGPVLRAFARGWVGSRYRAGKRMGGGLQLGSPRNPLRAGCLPSLPLVGRGDFPQPQKLRPHS